MRARPGSARKPTLFRSALEFALVLALLVAPSSARADGAKAPDPQDLAVAERLFLDGKILMQEKEYERACPKFEKSYQLDPTAVGTLLNLALCHEAIGRPASAWGEFRLVAAESRGKREDRVKLAEEHVQALSGVLSYLTVKVPGAARAPGLVITLDGKPVSEAALETEMPVDPGKRVVEATARGKLPWRTEITIGEKNDRQAVTVPALGDAPVAPGPEKREGVLSLEAADAIAAARARRIVGFALGGVGLASIGIGAVFGALALRAKHDSDATCPASPCPSHQAAVDARSSLGDAQTYANVANVTIGVGLLAAAGGAVLVIVSRPSGGATITASAAPSPSGGAFLVRGAF